MVCNLLQNAVKFTRQGESVHISVACDKAVKRAIIRIRDTGEGIEAKMLPLLFQPFMQAETSKDRSRGGLGLGLALSRGLVELHGGEINAQSAGPGKGSEFVVRLPLDETCTEEILAVPVEIPRHSHRMLIIEDNPDLAESLRELLELEGHKVEVAYSGLEGLGKAREFNPEVLLCDIGLPGMDGYAVVRAFRADEALKDVFMIALTGYAQPEDQRLATEAGFDRHMAKPLDLQELERLFAAATLNLGSGVCS